MNHTLKANAHRLEQCIIASPWIEKDKTCLQIQVGETWQHHTYAQLLSEVEKQAQLIQRMGLNPRDKIVLLSENSPATMVTFLAVLTAQCIPVMVDPTLAESQIAALIEFSESKSVFISQKYLDQYHNKLNIPQLVRNLNRDLSTCEGYSDRAQIDNIAQTPVDDDVAVILFTSGTTGFAKGVMLTHENLIAGMVEGKAVTETKACDRVLSVLPIHHISPLMHNLMSLYAGATITMINQLDGPSILSAMQATQPTIAGFVPLILELFLRNIEEKINQLSPHKKKILRALGLISRKIRKITGKNIGFYLFKSIQNVFGGALEKIICGGAPLDPLVLSKLETLGFTILEAYGLTETSGPMASNRLNYRKPASAGIPFANIEVSVKHHANALHEGEICVRGPLVMKGYFKDPTSTAQVLQDGWFYTGDAGYIDEEGLLKITGRVREMIVLSTGKKVFPADVESQYQGIQGVQDLAVFGMSGLHYSGERIHMAIVKNAQTTPQALQALIYQRSSELPAQFQIQDLYFLEELPKTTSLKIQRVKLKQWVMEQVLQPYCSGNSDESSDKPPVESEQELTILSWLKNWIHQHEHIAIEDVEVTKSFNYYGLDSLTSVQLCKELVSEFHIEVEPSHLQQYPAIVHLARYLATCEPIQVEHSEFKKMVQRITESDISKVKAYVSRMIRPKWYVRLVKKPTRFTFRLLCRMYFRVEIKGTENLPKDKAFIICPNHTSYLDSVVLGLVKRKISRKFVGLFAKDYFNKKSFPLVSLISDVVPFDRSISERAMEMNLKYIEFCKKANRILILFPEGTRSRDGQMQDFKNGVAWFAKQTGLDIIPAYIHGAFPLLPRGRFFPKPGKMSIVFGKPYQIQTDIQATDAEPPLQVYNQITQKLRELVVRLKESVK